MKSISQILKDSKTIAMVGLSNKPERDSYRVAEYMKEHGYRILPVNPSYAGQRIHGDLVYATLREAADALAATGQHIDIVDCFRKAEDIPPLAREAIAVRAGCLWMQLGIENRAAADLARAAGLDVVMNQCVKIAHKMMSA